MIVKSSPKLMTDSKPKIQEIQKTKSRIEYTQIYHFSTVENQKQKENKSTLHINI